MATIERCEDSRPVESGGVPDEPASPGETTDDVGDEANYFFWGINELYVAP